MNNLKKDVNEISNSIKVIKDSIIESKQDQEYKFNYLTKRVDEIHNILLK